MLKKEWMLCILLLPISVAANQISIAPQDPSYFVDNLNHRATSTVSADNMSEDDESDDNSSVDNVDFDLVNANEPIDGQKLKPGQLLMMLNDWVYVPLVLTCQRIYKWFRFHPLARSVKTH